MLLSRINIGVFKVAKTSSTPTLFYTLDKRITHPINYLHTFSIKDYSSLFCTVGGCARTENKIRKDHFGTYYQTANLHALTGH